VDKWPRQITLQTFVRRLHGLLSEPDCNLVWLLGAGCSVSSGIPGAAGLVRQWLPRLKRQEEGMSQIGKIGRKLDLRTLVRIN
jgi:hypothetical protein